MEVIGQWLNDSIFLPAIRFILEAFVAAFNSSLDILKTEAGQTPIQFSEDIVGDLRGISNTVIMPIAGLLLTYVFCYELITMITERNNMAEFDVQGLFWLIMRTTIAIMLITNCFNITLAFFDVGQELVNGAVGEIVTEGMPADELVTALSVTIGANVGTALIVLLFSFIAMLIGYVACALIYLVAWSRIVTILIYISVAPIPFATFMSKDWIGDIGRNYLKNLMALALQGFLMVVCMVIYGGLVPKAIGIVTNGDALMGIVAIIIGMFVCVKSLMSCQNLAKSIMGAQ